LTQVTQGSSTTESYGYDPVGNRLSSVGVPNYNYNSSNELTSNSLGSYSYDNNGSTLTDPSGKSYTWDFENRMASAVVPGTGTTNFKYDPFGRRIQKSGPLGTTNYLYDGKDESANVIEQVDNSGNILAKYTQSDLVDEPLSMLRSGVTSYVERDGLGSVTSLSTSAGVLASTYTFDSFGKLTASTGTLTNPFQYAGREFDPETGIYYYRARYYDPTTGRFPSEDPLKFGGGINFYAYVGNNVVNRTDPDGYGVVDCVKALAELVAATANVVLRTAAMEAHAGMVDPMQHAKALKQAVNRLKEALDKVEKHCSCDPKTQVEIAAAIVAAELALEAAAPYLVLAL
jgi:RHS repeat-associated protein